MSLNLHQKREAVFQAVDCVASLNDTLEIDCAPLNDENSAQERPLKNAQCVRDKNTFFAWQARKWSKILECNFLAYNPTILIHKLFPKGYFPS